MYCQLVNICGCIPARIRHALTDLPETLDGTYERTLREINKADWEFAYRLLQFVTVAARPLRVEELAELLAFDFKAGSIPKFHEDWRVEDPIHAVLSTCPSFLAIVDDKIHSNLKVVQFSHFSVKEFLTSDRLAESNDIILRRYHISRTPAHDLAARACLSYLLHLGKDVTNYSLPKLPLSKYSAEYWVDHVRLGDESQIVKDGLKELFEPNKPHLTVCIWIYDPSLSFFKLKLQSERPSPLRRTPLHYAALWDLHSIVEPLVNEHSQDVNSRDFTYSTPLHLASEFGSLEVARMLIERGASVSTWNNDGQTPLHLASQAGRLEVVRMLIDHGAGVSTRNKDGQTSLHLVSLGNWVPYLDSGESSYPEVARMLIERGADVSAQDKDGQPPLHLALQAGQLEVTHMLIELGAGVSTWNKDSETPLHLASQAGEVEIARMLIERGASVSAQNKDGHTPLHLALQAWPPWRLETARMLIKLGANVSAQNKHGQTPLHLALQAGRLEAARMLIELGANVSTQNKEGQTPLHLVSQGRRVEVDRMLIERGDSVFAENNDGHGPLNLASQAGQLEVAHMLIELGAGVSAQSNEGQTPLHLASRAGQLEVAHMLIECGASVSARNKDGQTPLHFVSLGNGVMYLDPEEFSNSDTKLARMLIERGADVSAQDYEGQTPVQLALQAGRLKVARMLIEYGAIVPDRNNDGTQFHLAYFGDADPIFDPFGCLEVTNQPGVDVSDQMRT